MCGNCWWWFGPQEQNIEGDKKNYQYSHARYRAYSIVFPHTLPMRDFTRWMCFCALQLPTITPSCDHTELSRLSIVTSGDK